MATQSYKPEEIVGQPRRAEVLGGQGMATAEAIGQLGISEVTFYGWHTEYGGMRVISSSDSCSSRRTTNGCCARLPTGRWTSRSWRRWPERAN